MSNVDDPAKDFATCAKRALQLLAEQKLPPIPANFEHFFLKEAREMGVRKAVLQRLRTTPQIKKLGASDAASEEALAQVLVLVLRAYLVERSTKDPLFSLFDKLLTVTEGGQLAPRLGEVVNALHRAGRRSVGQLKIPPIEEPPESLPSAAAAATADTTTGAERTGFLQLLRTLRPAMGLPAETRKALDTLINGFAAPSLDGEGLMQQVESFLGKHGLTIRTLPDQRRQLTLLVGVLLQSLRSASAGSEGFRGHLREFKKQVVLTETQEDLGAARGVLLQESTAMEDQIEELVDEFDTINSTVRQAHERIARLEEQLDKTKNLSLLDPLTQVSNRRGLEAWMGRSLMQGDEIVLPFALLMVDLDRFKKVNDSYGHIAGDGVLVETARRIQGAVREVDFVCRLGGEEFCVVLPAGQLKHGKVVALRILEALRGSPIDCDGTPVDVRTSLGVAESGEGETMDTVLERADKALYLAKESGRDRFCTQDELPAAGSTE